ncbi:hypothetical protein B0A55_03695 [Friedmanniomyces simplex]|uniref:Zn(2)-C6 fungal-type domain-containing protein n=1 Tax=Friedmanniomyces simplex TaxID=329884 RepID=A0A4U0XSJ6_9PEZI|nr:hypothetical protein B0A55_03695 [Friedmanniomyces simplex]
MTRNMMATQPYYGGGGEYDPFHRPLHRSQSTAGYYDRPSPYSYYDQPRQEVRADYIGRPVTRAMIQEPELEAGPAGSRRRIAVACSRCRRRKIKCSGDPGDGSGCQACRASGTDVNACNFIRVGSTTVGLNTGVEAYPPASSAGSISAGGTYSADTASSSGWNQGHYLPSRPSLPTLHTRSSWMDNYDGYENSPVDAYTYASSSLPRQDSYASSYGSIENYRSWSTTAPVSAPIAASYYEQQPTYSFGSLQAPAYTAPPSARLPSVTADAFSPLNMGSLHTSLPIQTAQERQLPVPYTIRYPTTTYPTQRVPQVRPLGSFSEPRAPTHGIHSRTAMPWSDSIPARTTTATASSCTPSIYGPSSYTQYDGLRYPQPVPRQVSVAPISEPVLGYQFQVGTHPRKAGSPDISPTSGPGLTDSFTGTAPSHSLGITTTSMAPPPTFRYASVMPATPFPAEDRPTTISASREATTASLYSFSTDSSSNSNNHTAGEHRPATSDDSSDHASTSFASTSSGGAGVNQQVSYAPVLRQSHHQQQQHGESSGALGVRRQSSFDQQQQQQQRATTAHRMSLRDYTRESKAAAAARPTPTRQGTRVISVDNVLQYASEIPSAQRRDPKLRGVGVPLSGGGAGVHLPARSSKLSEKLVLLPETSEEHDGEEKDGFGEDEDESAPPSDEALARRRAAGSRGKSEAERLPKSQRTAEAQLARVTAYCTAQSYRLRSTAQFVRDQHGARTKIYEDCLYCVYQLPLLGGGDGYRVRSSPVVKNPGGRSVLDEQIEANERREYREGWHEESDEYSVRAPHEGEPYVNPTNESEGAKEDREAHEQEQQHAENEQRRTNGWKEGNEEHEHDPNRRTSETLSLPSPQPTISPDAYNYAELFIFSYGVAVLWNFTPNQEKDLLADLTFSSNAASQPNDPKTPSTGMWSAAPTIPKVPSTSLSLKAAALAPPTTNLPLTTRPLDEDDFETEEFHFQYDPYASKPRIYNDMITLRTADHMIKLAMSYAIAQSTKLSFFEERMQRTMSEAQYVPRQLALKGKLGLSRREVVSLVGRLFEGRVDVNLSSNMLDTPNFFWDSEPTLHPLYAAIREYLEIRPRIQVLNERCRVFLDLAEILSDSIADVKMTRITWIIIVLIGVSIAVTCTEVVLRFAILARSAGGGGGGRGGGGVVGI